MKKVIAMALVIAALVAAVPIRAQATTEAQSISQTISQHYGAALVATEKESLGGFCGLMTSWQLHLMGINKYLLTADGNRQYDTYCDMKFTSGGYRVKAYSGAQYTLREILNYITDYGARNAYNLLVGFEWTNTEAGNQYGHAVVVYAILDGKVYFTEGFQTSYGGSEGGVTALTIEQFVRYYDDWTTFEGVIHFGKKDETFACASYESHFYAVTEKAQTLYSQPCAPGKEGTDCRILRESLPGERFLITGLFETSEKTYYYETEDCGAAAFLPAESVTPIAFCYDTVTAEKLVLPQRVNPNADFTVSGSVQPGENRISAIKVTVTDNAGETVTEHTGGNVDLTAANGALEFQKLEPGQYQCAVTATCENAYMKDGSVLWDSQQVQLANQAFMVGEGEVSLSADAASREILDGWALKSDGWYCYRKGAPRTGWVCEQGVDYYLTKEGKVTTGWAEINGKKRLFSNTGAMRTGWADTPGGKCYFLRNGAATIGWRKIDNGFYYFGEDGFMRRETWVEEKTGRYYLLADGTRASNGWHTLPEGRFFFQEDGKALAYQEEIDGVTYVRILEEKQNMKVPSVLDKIS